LGITVELAEKPVSCSANLLKTLSRVLSYISVCTATPKDPDIFLWEGLDRYGKRTRGEMVGVSDVFIKATLRQQGVNPLKVKKKAKPLFGGGKKKL
jgi:hypothetical protein